MSDYLDVNRANWDERVPVHAASTSYSLDRFADPAHLSDTVRFDLPLLGDIKGQRAVHLQCHIGHDTVSLSRLGARVTGLDFSEAALAQARGFAAEAGADTDFVHSDLYSALDVLPAGEFDLVFTGIGAICWLPSIERWAGVVAALLGPGGRLFIREGHPVLWSVDEARTDGVLALRYPYFETEEALVFDEQGTYTDADAVFTNTVSHSWNHGIGEIITALIGQGLSITGYTEHRSVPWCALPGRMTEGDDGEWRLNDGPERLPMSYTLQAVKTV